jgi:hypothetical protein
MNSAPTGRLRHPCKPTPAALLALLAGLACCGSAQSARPLITDDARIVDTGACQVESWVRSNRGSTEAWALPGCNPSGNLELTLGGGRLHDRAGSRTASVVLQGKTLFKPMEANSWGWGAALGVASDPRTGARDVYGYLPMSWSLRNDRSFVHANLGAKQEGPAKLRQMTWGLGLEQPVNDSFGLIGEAFSQDKGRPFLQFGLRYWLLRDRVQLDATAGRRWGSATDERWFSIGLRLLTPAFLP